MNLVRQRDDLKMGFKNGMLNQWQLDQSQQCPVFLFNHDSRALDDNEYEFVTTNLMTNDGAFPMRPPYPVFRIAYQNVPIYEQWFIGKNDALCFRCDSGYSMSNKTIHSLHHHTKDSKKVKFWAAIDGVPVDASTNTWRAGKLKCELSKEQITEFINSPLNCLAFFLLDVMTPKNAIIKVSPNPTGRSVEWVKAREHYLVIPKRQAMAIRERKTDQTEHEIKRAAHWRIAHFRRLVSDRFKTKKGLLIPVKEAWIGPKEWIGTDGKIYKVQNV